MITCSLQSLPHLNISALFLSANAIVVSSLPWAWVTDVSGCSAPVCTAVCEIIGCAEITGFVWSPMLTSILMHRLLFAELLPWHCLFRLGNCTLRLLTQFRCLWQRMSDSSRHWFCCYSFAIISWARGWEREPAPSLHTNALWTEELLVFLMNKTLNGLHEFRSKWSCALCHTV